MHITDVIIVLSTLSELVCYLSAGTNTQKGPIRPSYARKKAHKLYSRQFGTQETIDVQGTQGCKLRKDPAQGCVITYKATENWEQCYLKEVMQGLALAVDLNALTNGFINQERFSLKSITRDDCQQNQISISIVSRESHATACGYFTVRGGGEYTVNWKLQAKTFKDFQISGSSKTSIGQNDQFTVSFNKAFDQETVNISVTVPGNRELSVQDFAKKFDVDMAELFPERTSNVRAAIDPASLILTEAGISGIIFPKMSFEIYAIGKLITPAVFQKSRETILVAQHFKEETDEGTARSELRSSKPSFAIVSLFDGITTDDFISFLLEVTQLQLPKFNIIENMREFAFTVCNKDISLIYNENINTFIASLQTIEDQHLAHSGINVRFIKKKMKSEARNIDPNVDTKDVPKIVSVVGDLSKTEVRFTIVEKLAVPLRMLPAISWGRENEDAMLGEVRDIVNRPGTVQFDAVVFKQEGVASKFTVSGNQTDEIRVIPNIFSLSGSTLIFTTEKAGGSFSPWKFSANGENFFLDEISNITIFQDEKGQYFCKGNSAIYNMDVLRNRTRANYIQPLYESFFTHTEKIALKELNYIVSFDPSSMVLRLVGKADIEACDDNHAEIHYWTNEGDPRLAVGFFCKNSRLDKVVDALYGQPTISQTWMTFDRIGLVLAIESSPDKFQDEFLDKATKEPGIRIITDGLQLDSVLENDTYLKMARLLKFHYGSKMQLEYQGECSLNSEGQKFIPSIAMEAVIKDGFCQDSELQVTGLVSSIKKIKRGEFARLTGTCRFRSAGLSMTCMIFVDGSGKLRIRLKQKQPPSSEALIPLSFLELDRIQALSPYPWDKCPEGINLNAGMSIGSNREQRISFSRGGSEQYVSFRDPREHTFLGTAERTITLESILNAFGISSHLKFFANAKCQGRLVVAYSGGARGVWVPEYNMTIDKDLHFLCYMNILGQNRLTQCKYEKEQEISCTIFIEEALNVSSGFVQMSYSSDELSVGPVVRATFGPSSATASLSGFIQTVGIEKPCSFKIEDVDKDGRVLAYFSATVSGKIYNEIEGTMLLNAHASSPEDMELSIIMDLREQVQGKLPGLLAESLREHKENIETKIGKIANQAAEDEATYQDHSNRIAKLEEQLKLLIVQVKEMGENIQESAFQLSQDCLDKARVVSMPGLDFDESCVNQNDGKTSVCLKWKEGVTKALKISDLAKCEAEKVKSYLESQNKIKNIQYLLNNIIVTKGDIENQRAILRIREEIKSSSVKIDTFVKENTKVVQELQDVLGKTESPATFFKLNSFHISSSLKDVYPPKLPYNVEWELYGKEPINSVIEVIHMFPFWESLVDEIIKASFKGIKKAQGILEGADFMSGEVDKLKNKLSSSIDEMREKRSSVPGSHHKNILGKEHSYLLKLGEPNLPQFTVMSDATMLGFYYHSPWAVLRDRDPFTFLNQQAIRGLTNTTISERSHCGQIRSVVQNYGAFAEDIYRMGANYLKGKDSLARMNLTLWKDLKDLQSYIKTIAAESKGSKNDIKSMMYWLDRTKEGLKDFGIHSINRLKEHNGKVFSLYRRELNEAYSRNKVGGIQNYLAYLSDSGRNAYKRSTGTQDSSQQGMLSLNEIAKTFSALMSEENIGIEDALIRVDKITGQLDFMTKQIKHCA